MRINVRRLARPAKVLASLSGLVLVLGASTALPAWAAGDSLALTSGSPASGAGVQLSAHLTGSGAAPLANTTVDFYVHLDEFSGAPELLIGTARTDAAGDASIVYQPTWAGTQHFAATALDATNTVVATTSLTAQAARTDPFAGPVESLRPDGLIGRWVVVVLLSLVLTVWITLFALVVRVQRGPAQPAR